MLRGDPREEYKDLSDNMRHYGNVQFAQLTVLVAVTAGLLTLLFTSDPPLQPLVKLVIKIAGLSIALIFWIILESAMYVWRHFAKRAAELEKDLDYKQYSTLPGAPKFKYRPGTWGIRLFCLSIIIFWLVMMIWHQQF